MDISLTPELEKFVATQLQTGRYHSASEVVCEGLRLLDDHDRQRSTQMDELRRKIQIGLKQLDRGEGIPGHQILAELK